MTATDILKHLNYTKIPDKILQTELTDDRKSTPIAVDYIFDIAPYGTVSTETVRANIYREYGLRDSDNSCSYHIDDVNDGIALCKELAAELGLNFTQEIASHLRNRAGNGNSFLLFILERPLYGR